MMEKKAAKLERSLGGIKNMGRLPDIVYIVDPRKEDIAVAEGQKTGISLLAIVDSNCDPRRSPTPSRATTTPFAPSACSPPGGRRGAGRQEAGRRTAPGHHRQGDGRG